MHCAAASWSSWDEKLRPHGGSTASAPDWPCGPMGVCPCLPRLAMAPTCLPTLRGNGLTEGAVEVLSALAAEHGGLSHHGGLGRRRQHRRRDAARPGSPPALGIVPGRWALALAHGGQRPHRRGGGGGTGAAAPWYETSPNLIRVTAQVLDRANAKQVQRFVGELNALGEWGADTERRRGDLPVRRAGRRATAGH